MAYPNITVDTDGHIRFDGQVVGEIATDTRHGDKPVRALAEALTTCRYVGSVFDEWVDSVACIMALYDDLDWSEALPAVVEEVREARAKAGGR